MVGLTSLRLTMDIAIAVIIICCIIMHFVLANRQEAKHARDISNIRRILNNAVKAKVKKMTQARRVARCQCQHCHCVGQWEIREMRSSLSEDILGPVDLYLSMEPDQRTQ